MIIRRGLLFFLLISLFFLFALLYSVWRLLSLLVEDYAADEIHFGELPSPNSSLIEQRRQIIPKIIHQTYKNETIPERWVNVRQSCLDLHADYEYIVGTLMCPNLNPYGVNDCSSSGRTESLAT